MSSIEEKLAVEREDGFGAPRAYLHQLSKQFFVDIAQSDSLGPTRICIHSFMSPGRMWRRISKIKGKFLFEREEDG